ncbi:hypothetical protein [Streptomyces sp. ERV7]|nr:hypothetical protein [Streptomyces sp. ERV7]
METYSREMWRTVRLAITSTGMTVRLCAIILVATAVPWLITHW